MVFHTLGSDEEKLQKVYICEDYDANESHVASFIKYQYRKEHGKLPDCKIILDCTYSDSTLENGVILGVYDYFRSYGGGKVKKIPIGTYSFDSGFFSSFYYITVDWNLI